MSTTAVNKPELVNMQAETMTKTQFAAHMNVSRGAVSKWIQRGTITDEALVGEGRKAKINVAVAAEQVRRNRDVGQSLGNGIGTGAASDETPVTVQTDDSKSVTPAVSLQTAHQTPIAEGDRVEDRLKAAKLEEQLRRNRIQASDEALRQGLLVSAEDARGQMAGIAGKMLNIFEGALPEFAAAVAAQLDVPQRDILHALQSEFKKVRGMAEEQERARAAAAEKDMKISVELEA